MDEHPCVTSNNDLVQMRLRPKGLRSLRFGEAAFYSTIPSKRQVAEFFNTLLDLGRRIAIIGWSSTGKSTLAHRLGLKLDLPVTHLDTIFNQPNTNWQARP